MSADPAGFGLINPMDAGKPRSGYSIVEAMNWYSYVSHNPVRYIDPTGAVNWDAFGDGLVMAIVGGVKCAGGVALVAASGGAEVASAGASTPLSVVGVIMGVTFAVDGAVEGVIGLAILADGLMSEPGDNSYQEIPTTLSEMLGIAGDEVVEQVSGQESDVLQKTGEFVGDLGPTPGVKDFLLPEDPEMLHAPGNEDLDSGFPMTPLKDLPEASPLIAE